MKDQSSYSIIKIIKDNWKEYLKYHYVENYQKYEVEKMLECSKSSCNSRICSSCGKKYTDRWTQKLQVFLPNSFHKHVVLTVPETLRLKFRNWNNLKILMDCSANF